MTKNVVYRERDPRMIRAETANKFDWICHDGTLCMVLGNDGIGGVHAVRFSGGDPEPVNIDAGDMVMPADVRITWSKGD